MILCNMTIVPFTQEMINIALEEFTKSLLVILNLLRPLANGFGSLHLYPNKNKNKIFRSVYMIGFMIVTWWTWKISFLIMQTVSMGGGHYWNYDASLFLMWIISELLVESGHWISHWSWYSGYDHPSNEQAKYHMLQRD